MNNLQQGEMFQVPPSVVKGIVITVLQSQGIVNPSEEILQKAIQEYYNKNPQGVGIFSMYYITYYKNLKHDANSNETLNFPSKMHKYTKFDFKQEL